MNIRDNSDQKFRWPETKNPILIIVRFFGKFSILLLIGAVYLFNKLGIKSELPFLIIMNFFLLSMAWLFLQQKLKVYKILGWVVVFSTIYMSLAKLFPDVFAITPWW
ncbi:hypothetical protein A2967_01880 [Candidatus Daviesbacteria bacterium RIFCSPLOWO2_01_FULL_41_32]|nr:MAG: hypothetical protein A2967_01880 [Candidatus Daviesbacteria bacterium RIFCSPLOWO2_01_FULL_41_32]